MIVSFSRLLMLMAVVCMNVCHAMEVDEVAVSKHFEKVRATRVERFQGKSFYFDTEVAHTEAAKTDVSQGNAVQITVREMIDGTQTGRILNLYLNPGAVKMNSYAFKAHKLTHEFLSLCPEFNYSTWQHLKAFLGDNPLLVAHNASFDIRVLMEEFARLGRGETFNCRVVCSLAMARRDQKRFRGKLQDSPAPKKVQLQGKSRYELVQARIAAEERREKLKTKKRNRSEFEKVKIKDKENENKNKRNKKTSPSLPSLKLSDIARELNLNGDGPALHVRGSQVVPHSRRGKDHDAVTDTRKGAGLLAQLVYNPKNAAQKIAELA